MDERDTVEERLTRLLSETPPSSTPLAEFRGRQFDLGLAWVHFPEGRGGLGADRRLQAAVERRLAAAGLQDRSFYTNGVGLNLVAPAIVAHGDALQQERYLRRIFTCEDIWCQLFSEPGAGSDLAGLATRAAAAAGGGWTVTGQKVWTTLAHRAAYGLLLARTDPDVPKHAGLSAFVLDMRSPGVEVRGIREITGEYEFNEVFLDGAAMPREHLLGEEGGGWQVALTMLSEERVAYFGDVGERGSGPIGAAVDLWHRRADKDPALRDDLVRVWMDAEAVRLTNARVKRQLAEGNPGPEGSVVKVTFAETTQRVYDLCLELAGPDALRYGGGYAPVQRSDMSTMVGDDWRKMYLRSKALSIEGGTSEIMRTIIGERVLGLPKEPRTDTGRPWSQVPRS